MASLTRPMVVDTCLRVRNLPVPVLLMEEDMYLRGRSKGTSSKLSVPVLLTEENMYHRRRSKGSSRPVPVILMVEDTSPGNIGKPTRIAISMVDMPPTSIRKAKDREIGR